MRKFRPRTDAARRANVTRIGYYVFTNFSITLMGQTKVLSTSRAETNFQRHSVCWIANNGTNGCTCVHACVWRVCREAHSRFRETGESARARCVSARNSRARFHGLNNERVFHSDSKAILRCKNLTTLPEFKEQWVRGGGVKA